MTLHVSLNLFLAFARGLQACFEEATRKFMTIKLRFTSKRPEKSCNNLTWFRLILHFRPMALDSLQTVKLLHRD